MRHSPSMAATVAAREAYRNERDRCVNSRSKPLSLFSRTGNWTGGACAADRWSSRNSRSCRGFTFVVDRWLTSRMVRRSRIAARTAPPSESIPPGKKHDLFDSAVVRVAREGEVLRRQPVALERLELKVVLIFGEKRQGRNQFGPDPRVVPQIGVPDGDAEEQFPPPIG